jgi:hypothetical protein
MSEDVLIPTGKQGNVADPEWGLRCEKKITFAGATTDAWGNDGGALDGAALFLVTGTVRARLIGIVEVTCTKSSSAVIEVGVPGATAGIIAQTAADALVIGEIWHDNSPDNEIELDTVAVKNILANGLDIILTVSGGNVLTGAVKFICCWYPLSADGRVVPSAL